MLLEARSRHTRIYACGLLAAAALLAPAALSSLLVPSSKSPYPSNRLSVSAFPSNHQVILQMAIFGGFLTNTANAPTFLNWLRYLSLLYYPFEVPATRYPLLETRCARQSSLPE